jgi:serine/threonine-protein kinase
LTDFGIALGGAGTTGEPALTATGELVGTLRYLAPEQLRGAPATPASDVHALAAVTYEMLANRHAYEAASPVALAEAQARGVEPIPSVPPALDVAVRRALSPDPADRPADAAAFAAEILEALATDRTEPVAIGAPIADLTSSMPAPPPAPVVPVPLPAPMPAPADDPAAPLWDPEPATAATAAAPPSDRRRRGALSVPMAAMLALTLAFLVIAAMARSIVPGATVSEQTRTQEPGPASAAPVETVAPSAEPIQPPAHEDKGKGKGNGKGHKGGG